MRYAISWVARGVAATFLTVAGGGTLGAASAPATLCALHPPAYNARVADAVFVGSTVREIDDNAFQVRVSAIYKGSPDAWTVVDGGDWAPYVGIELEPRRQYVFYGAYDHQTDQWTVNVCDGTTRVFDKALATAEAELGPPTPLRPADSPTAGDADPSPAAATEDQADDEVPPWLWVGGGAAAVAVVGIGLSARRRWSAGG